MTVQLKNLMFKDLLLIVVSIANCLETGSLNKFDR